MSKLMPPVGYSQTPVKTEATDRDAPKTISTVAVLACAWPALLLATVAFSHS